MGLYLFVNLLTYLLLAKVPRITFKLKAQIFKMSFGDFYVAHFNIC